MREDIEAYALLRYIDRAVTLGWPPNDAAYDPVERCPQNAACYMANCPFEEFPVDTDSRYEQYITCENVGDMQRRASKAVPDTDVSPPTFLNFGFAGIPSVGASSINSRHFLFPPSPVVTQSSDLTEIWRDNYCFAPKPRGEERGRRCTHTYKVNNPTVEPGAVELLSRYEP